MELGDKAKGYPVGQRQDLLTLVWELSSASISMRVASAFSLATNILIITGNAIMQYHFVPYILHTGIVTYAQWQTVPQSIISLLEPMIW